MKNYIGGDFVEALSEAKSNVYPGRAAANQNNESKYIDCIEQQLIDRRREKLGALLGQHDATLQFSSTLVAK